MRGVMLAAIVATSCHRPPDATAVEPEPTVVTFAERSFDAEPFLVGNPWDVVLPLPERGLVVLDRVGAERHLYVGPLDGTDLEATARQLSPIDWSSRSRWTPRYHPGSDSLLFLGDESNDEAMNLYRMSLASGELERLTDEPYLYGFGVSPDGSEAAILARRGEEPFTTCLERVHLVDGTQTPVVCDTPEARFVWSEPAWSPDGSGVLTRVNVHGDRDRGNLAWIAVDGREITLLTDPTVPRSRVSALARWVDATHAIVVDDFGGSTRVSKLAPASAQRTELFATQDAITAVRLLTAEDETATLLVTTHTSLGDELHAVALDGAHLGSVEVAGTVRHHGAPTSIDHVTVSSAESPLSGFTVRVGPSGPILEPWLAMPEGLRDTLSQCDVEAVEFPTHDTDASGATRRLHGYLYTPRSGAPEASEAIVRILAFYGGGNTFSAETQLFCRAGVSTFSPAVRGVPGFGPEFSRLNDGDLGGDEIADLFAAARWLETRGYAQEHIGVYGRSHGGYATMRALTYPDGSGGHEAYPFAFGLADAGFSDIAAFHEATNIPDWVLLEAGDPATEGEKLAQRSPLTHVERLEAPLLLTHGSEDQRVPVAGSRAFFEACQVLERPCWYEEFEGQGHRVNGLANEVRLIRAKLAHLERLEPVLPAE